ncbi:MULTISPECIES: lactose-specific PTS transporter subunit EIIC [Lactobacillales]|uniref:PTS system lactose-specific EIICB component n=1 Tax=Aerococcus urinaeequi TaxID=51665 RepID=A0ABR5ZWJ5_9LACT|nr:MULTISPECIES: lactose-specific PTS transporter subunit EIIC [Lactobacillales]KAF3299142.1 PTS transporter subunit EIIC [Carnobacterium sp. PL26RED25]KAF3299154.1 PTS transporter subunit EIIC [Carnobacterium sp. PL12RED10]KAF3304199.1 PTS transporter subunit EIIC [Carnobacterium sp. PL24RED07]MBA5746103.1 PTS lactose transporter subunit IIBC [Aerococcus urinaeequi]MBA5828887.1 PTS lactose transporter subunit IIBC [Aerococcus urinaeequi]
MDKLISQIEKMKPFFEKLSRNIYLRAIKDGFISAMPVVLFSSIFMLIAYVPNVWGFYWSDEVVAFIVKPYTFSMGILGLLVSATTARALTDSYNRRLPATKQLNRVSTMIAAIVVFLFLSSTEIAQGEGDAVVAGFSSGYLGTTGLLAAFVAAFITVIVYNFCMKNDIAIRMPEEVPPNISQAFTDVIPFAIAVVIAYGIDIAIRAFTGVSFAQAIIQMFQPLFTAADGYVGIAIIYGAIGFFWFIGIHGPSIVEPAITAIAFLNMDANLALIQGGEHAANIITPGLQYFVATLGGTGATFVVPYLFMWFGKSKQNKAVGKASFIPTSFGVNEPILFGGPLVLNPVFFVPFVLAPILNVWIFKFFVEVFGMNGFSYFLPWPTPGPIGIVLGTGIAPLSFVVVALLIAVDAIIYYPFFKVYDKQILEKELSNEDEIIEEQAETKADATEVGENDGQVSTGSHIKDEVSVLVLCAGAGTSGLLANALNKGAKEYDVPVVAGAGAYGAHQEIMGNYDLIILAPQVVSNYDDIKEDADRLNVKLVKTKGKEYISLTRDPKAALEFVDSVLKEA